MHILNSLCAGHRVPVAHLPEEAGWFVNWSWIPKCLDQAVTLSNTPRHELNSIYNNSPLLIWFGYNSQRAICIIVQILPIKRYHLGHKTSNDWQLGTLAHTVYAFTQWLASSCTACETIHISLVHSLEKIKANKKRTNDRAVACTTIMVSWHIGLEAAFAVGKCPDFYITASCWSRSPLKHPLSTET